MKRNLKKERSDTFDQFFFPYETNGFVSQGKKNRI